ncbi:MAG: DNA primase [Thaumarchaeota archaeon]|nr:DNA primase [Nitrososphaerota archaeon]
MEGIGRADCARYPFLDNAGEYIADKGYTIEAFGRDPDLVPFIELAMRRVEAAASGLVYSSDLDGGDTSERSVDREVFSFVVAAVLLRAAGARSLVRRFALSESRRAERFLEKSLARESRERDVPARLLEGLFSVRVRRADYGYGVPVASYVRRSVNFHEREWKLVNRDVHAGLVRLTAHQVVRLVRQELADHIAGRIRQSPTPPDLPNFAPHVARIRELSESLEPKYVEVTGEHPPCIKHAMEVLERGENLPHSGRFMLATFLLGRGWEVARIAPLFKGAPDYNEKTTLYQLNNISGADGGTRYSCPLCDKLETQGLCHRTAECEGIISPMQFGRRQQR